MKVLLLSLCLMLSGLATGSASQTPFPEEIPEDYVIGLEDVLAINVWREPDISVKEVVVRPDGKVSVPLIGDIQADGLTPMELQEQVSTLMEEFVASPTITVVVLRIGSRSVSIVGKVARPGIYYLGSPMTVLELLARAGGLRENANKKNISIVRQEDTQTHRFTFNYKDVSKGKNLKQNIILKNGDQVIVP